MVTTAFKKLLWVLPLLVFSQLSLAKAEARLDRTVISLNETVTLTISVDETSIFGGPDIDALEKNFDVRGPSKSSNVSIINGKKSATTEWRYQLAARQAGMYTIPAIEVSGEKTQPLTLQVKTPSQNPAASGDPLFIEVSTDKKEAYVQQQILLTIRINSSVQLQDVQLEELKLDNNLLQQQVSNTQYRRMINGTPYITHELVIALFPQASGDIIIPAISALAVATDTSRSRHDVFGRMFNQGKQYRLRSLPVPLTIHEIPPASQGSAWLPASQLKLSESWSADPENIQLGDSITRTITTTAVGLTAEQLPPVEIAASKQFKTYPDQPQLNNETGTAGIIGSRVDSIALVATQPGQITLPEITVEWWDTGSNSLQTATLSATTITVKGEMPAANTTTPTPSVRPDTQTAPALPQANTTTKTVTVIDNKALRLWQAATLICALGMLLFAVLWWRQRQPSSTTAPERAAPHMETSQLLKHLQIACQNQNPNGIRTALLAWARQHWPDQRIHSTMDISRLMAEPRFNDYMQKLDAALYTGSQYQQWEGLYQLVAEYAQDAGTNSETLPPLYPVN